MIRAARLAPVVTIVLTAGLTAACSSLDPEDFAGRTPEFRIEDYFVGETRAWGMFQDRSGEVRRTFTVDIEGTWDGETLTLVEDFLYDDGETEQRVWRIAKTGEHAYEGTADGVVGVARGEAYGDAMNWRYVFDLDIGSRSIHVRFDDWLFLQEDGVVLNRATVSKLGVRLGEVTLAFQRPPED